MVVTIKVTPIGYFAIYLGIGVFCLFGGILIYLGQPYKES
jgi:hypothetical protein